MTDHTGEHEPGCASLLHTYTEASARARLARRRSQGEALSMFHCPWGDHWHTITEAERADYFGSSEAQP